MTQPPVGAEYCNEHVYLFVQDLIPGTIRSIFTKFFVQCEPKKRGHRLVSIILSNLNRLKFFSV